MTSPSTTAERLLDAQVAWVVQELTGNRLLEVVERDLDELLAGASEVRLADVASPDGVIAAVEVLLTSLPASPLASVLARMAADQVHAGPSQRLVPGDVVDRAQVAALVDAVLALRPLVGQALDRLTASPLVGTLASRFVARLVVDVLEANRSMARRVPGVGSIVSFGTSAATRMVGVADKQVQALFGDTATKGTAMAVRRLNSVVMATLEDPALRDAVLEVWDTWADEPLTGVGDVVDREDLRRVAATLQDIGAAGAPTAAVRSFVAAWIRALFEQHGDTPLATLLDDLGLAPDDLRAIAAATVPPLVAAAVADGRLEAGVRARLEPFFHSPAVTAILEG